MNELLVINEETQTVSARDLHESLNIKTAFKDWFPRMCDYGFIQGEDFNLLKNERVQIEGNREVKRAVTDAELSLDMAKHICMLQRTEEGKQVRQYLIDLEKAWNTPEQIMARALKLADRQIQSLTSQVELMKPKADFFDTVADSKTAISMNEVAKVLNYKDIGRNKLFQFLRDLRILDKRNVPYQRYVDEGWFRVIEQSFMRNGEPVVTTKTLVYQKGVDAIRKKLIKYIG